MRDDPPLRQQATAAAEWPSRRSEAQTGPNPRLLCLLSHIGLDLRSEPEEDQRFTQFVRFPQLRSPRQRHQLQEPAPNARQRLAHRPPLQKMHKPRLDGEIMLVLLLLEAYSECYRGRDCHHRIHKDCVMRYQCFPPWSYCDLELGFSVWVDCWVPKSLENSVRVRKRKMNRSRVLGSKSLEDGASDAKRAVEKKAADAAKAKENALGKAVVARRALEFAIGALELVLKKGDSGVMNDCSVTSSSSASDSTVVDVELAFQLHCAINSSPRISRKLCLVNSSCLPVPRVRGCSGNSPVVLFGL